MWSLGVVLFVLLSGSHVPFGNRGLCWTTVPNMPGLKESVDKLQKWLEVRLGTPLSHQGTGQLPEMESGLKWGAHQPCAASCAPP